jgi:predicted phage-related endonuclease
VSAWPCLAELGLAPKTKASRLAGIGGSDANVILSGDEEWITRLWREKRGEAEARDLSSILAAMLGSWTDAFNRQWYEQEIGYLVSRIGEVGVCAEHGWRRCTLDGFVGARAAVFEAKHVSAFARPEEMLARYMPQLQHNVAVTRAETGLLSVIFGNQKWEVYEIAADWLFQEELLIAEARFWDCVRSGELPDPAPVPPRLNPSVCASSALKGTTPGPPRGRLARMPRGGQTPCDSHGLAQGSGRGRCDPRLRPRGRDPAQQGWRAELAA